MHKVILSLVDDRKFFPMKPRWARNLITGLARIDGYPVGIVANNSMFFGGILDVNAADKAARFINLCDAFNIPLLFLQDVPGFMVGTKVEQQGIIRHGAKMLYAVATRHGAQVHRGGAQGLRRRLLRDERPRLRAGPAGGLAGRGDRRDGAGGHGLHRRAQAAAGRREPRGREGDEGGAGRRACASTSASTAPRRWGWWTT